MALTMQRRDFISYRSEMASETSRSFVILGVVLFLLLACQGSDGTDSGRAQAVTVSVSPSAVSVPPGNVQKFTATVTGTANDAVTWAIAEGSAGGAIDANGLYTASTSVGTYHVIATSVSDASQSATATVTIGGQVTWTSAARYAAMVSPVDGETFVGPIVALRFIAAGYDESVDTNYPTDGHGKNATSVDFLVDGTSRLIVTGAEAEQYVFKGFVTGLVLAPGAHTVVARATYANPPAIIDSPPVAIIIQAAPAYGNTIELTGPTDVATLLNLVGSAGSRIRVNGHGYAITGSGSVNWRYVDFYDVGNPASTGTPGIDVTSNGNVTVESCRFDYSNPVRFSIEGTAEAAIRGNLWRSNMRQPIGAGPDNYGGSYAAVILAGGSGATKMFAGNNVGAGWVEFNGTKGWTIGGDTDADSNVMIGPRVGIQLSGSFNTTLRRNFSHHIYYGGWSQGANFEMGDDGGALIEHNVLVGGSWTVRRMAGEFRYNLVINPTSEGMVWPSVNALLHHNVFIGAAGNKEAIFNPYTSNDNIRILNNTFDASLGGSGLSLILSAGRGAILDSNAIANSNPVPGSWPVKISSGDLAASNNLFFNSKTPHYSDGREVATDVTSAPLFESPVTRPYEYDEKAMWERTTTVTNVLQGYRARYAPAAGSPLIDAGGLSTFGPGNDIGAIGAGTINAADRFGQ